MWRTMTASAVVLCCASPVMAQDPEDRLAVGATYSALALESPDQTGSGVGGWLTWDGTPWLGFDVGVNIFPEEDELVGRQFQLLAGIRSGLRRDGWAAFGRARPGLVHFTERFIAPDTVCIAIFPPPEGCLAEKNNFALDLGGTLEFYPSESTVVRIDAGDTMIRFSRDAAGDSTWTNNFQFSAGLGFRFR